MNGFHIYISVFLSILAAAGRIRFYIKPEISRGKLLEYFQSEDTRDMPIELDQFQETAPGQKRDSISENEMATQANELMEHFTKSLKKYLEAYNHNWVNFDPQLEDLKMQFANISVAVENVSPCKELSQSLKLAEERLQTIEETRNSLQGFKDLGLTVFVWNTDSTFSSLSKHSMPQIQE